MQKCNFIISLAIVIDVISIYKPFATCHNRNHASIEFSCYLEINEIIIKNEVLYYKYKILEGYV